MRAKDVLGIYGEEVAVRHLQDAGWSILARNWRCEIGELDVVALDGDVLVFCEVKTRSGLGFGSPVEAVTRAKALRQRRLAARWLDSHGGRTREIRFDVIGVLRRRRGGPVLEHVRGAG